MATLQSISKHVDSFDDVITREPIKSDDGKHTKNKQPNGKIRTKNIPQGVEMASAELFTSQSSSKDGNNVPLKTKKKMSAFRKISLELLQGNDGQSGNTKVVGITNTELGEYHFKRRVSHFVNMAFENNELETSNLKFADVVRKVINDPIKEDIHPFGRGHLYASAFDGDRPKIHQDEGKYLMWILATLFIIGIAGSVIFMSITYQPDVVSFDLPSSTPITRQNTTT